MKILARVDLAPRSDTRWLRATMLQRDPHLRRRSGSGRSGSSKRPFHLPADFLRRDADFDELLRVLD